MAKRVPPLDRLFAKTAPAVGGCLEWQARIDRHGYGRFSFKSRIQLAHRVAYQLARGPIPDGLTIDHLCRNKRCVNPLHLEVVTRLENMKRVPLRTHCQNGHEYTYENTRIRKDNGWTTRICRACICAAGERRRRKQGRPAPGSLQLTCEGT